MTESLIPYIGRKCIYFHPCRGAMLCSGSHSRAAEANSDDDLLIVHDPESKQHRTWQMMAQKWHNKCVCLPTVGSDFRIGARGPTHHAAPQC